MFKNAYPGKFIVFEGLDGSGQSTQANLLYDWFKKRGDKVFLTKEPTVNTQTGIKIRKILQRKEKLGAAELQKLFIQNRTEHLTDLIIPGLKEGAAFISDRYFLSTCAFGGINLDIDWLIGMNNDFITPDITFFLDVSPEICLERIGKRGQGFEFFEEKEKLTHVRENYLFLITKFENVFLIDGELSKTKVFNQVLKLITTKKL